MFYDVMSKRNDDIDYSVGYYKVARKFKTVPEMLNDRQFQVFENVNIWYQYSLLFFSLYVHQSLCYHFIGSRCSNVHWLFGKIFIVLLKTLAYVNKITQEFLWRTIANTQIRSKIIWKSLNIRYYRNSFKVKKHSLMLHQNRVEFPPLMCNEVHEVISPQLCKWTVFNYFYLYILNTNQAVYWHVL